MKKASKNIRSFIVMTFIASLFVIVSCSTNETAENPKEVAEKQNDIEFDTQARENDAQFLVNAAEMNMEEIRLGQLAQQKGQSTEVKELGKIMEESHSKSLQDLTALAKSKNVTIPTSPTENAQESYRKLNEKSTDDFDEAYADLMVNEHKDAIEAFEKASKDCQDPDIKNWATSSLPDLRKHHNHSVECQKKIDKM